MPEPTTSAGDAAPPVTEDQAIRQRVKGLTSQVLQQGRVDPAAVRDVVRAVIGRAPGNGAVSGTEARELFADAVRGLAEALVKSASATHGALQQLASRGKDFTDNDLKEALVSLRKLEEDYMAAANRVAEAMSGNPIQREHVDFANLLLSTCSLRSPRPLHRQSRLDPGEKIACPGDGEKSCGQGQAASRGAKERVAAPNKLAVSTKNRSGRYSEIERREAIARERPRVRAGMRDRARLTNLRDLMLFEGSAPRRWIAHLSPALVERDLPKHPCIPCHKSETAPRARSAAVEVTADNPRVPLTRCPPTRRPRGRVRPRGDRGQSSGPIDPLPPDPSSADLLS
jgi:hypothetical protein